MKELRIATRDLEGGVTVLDLEGVLEKGTAPELEKAMTGLEGAARSRFVVNCERLASISSDGMGVFLSHLIKIRQSGGDIKFCNMREDARTVLSYLGLAKLLTVKESERDAVSDFKKTDPAKEAAREPEKLTIETKDEGAVSVVALKGFIDRHTLETLDRTLKGLLERGRTRVVVDCADLTYVSSNGMGVFISYVSKARNLGGDVRFCSMRDIAKTVVTMLGLHRLFEVHETRAAAIASFK